MTRYLTCILLSALLIAQAQAEGEVRNWIYQHNDQLEEGEQSQGANYKIRQFLQRVEIYAGETGETFEFEARKEELQGEEWVDIGAGDINMIEASENAGPVRITIVGHGHTYGARRVREINLGAAGVQSTIGQLEISGDLAELGDVRVDTVSGVFSVGNRVLNDIVVESLLGHVMAGGLGNLTATGTGTHSGSVSVSTTYAGTISLNGSCTGSIAIGAMFMGAIECAGDLQDLWINSPFFHTGDIHVGGNLFGGSIGGPMYGNVDIGGDLVFSMWMIGDITGSVKHWTLSPCGVANGVGLEVTLDNARLALRTA